MSDKSKHIEDIAEIKKLMERSSKFISLSGMSGVVAGILGIAGAVFLHWYIFYFFKNSSESLLFKNLPLTDEIVLVPFITAIFIFVLAIGSGFMFTYRRAKRKGHSIFEKTAYRVIFNLLIPLIAGGILSVIMLLNYQIIYIPGITLIFYGLALVNASHFTLPDIRVLGFIEIILGLTACIFENYSIIIWGIGFGVFHIIYGILMYIKYEKKTEN